MDAVVHARTDFPERREGPWPAEILHPSLMQNISPIGKKICIGDLWNSSFAPAPPVALHAPSMPQNPAERLAEGLFSFRNPDSPGNQMSPPSTKSAGFRNFDCSLRGLAKRRRNSFRVPLQD